MQSREPQCRTLSAAAVDLVTARFRILGEPVRVRLLEALQEGEKSVSALAAEVRTSRANVSKHLRLMQSAGVVGRRPVGNVVFYFIADASVLDLCSAVCASIGERLLRDAKIAAELNREVADRD